MIYSYLQYEKYKYVQLLSYFRTTTSYKSKCPPVYCIYIIYSSVKMKILLTVIALLVLSTNRLVVADDQCTQYQFRAPFYSGRSCKDIYIMNPESHQVPGYYWIIDSPTLVYCGMNYTGPSCEDIYNNNPETGDNNGYYPINNTQWVFCNMTGIATAHTVTDSHVILSCAGVKGEWRRIASINISAGDDCPTEWNKSSYNGVSFCRAPSDNAGCYSTFFSTNRVSYQHVCGRARGYQKGATDAFENFYSQTIDSYYVDGLSITHGNPRQHIWTYAAGLTDNGSISCCDCPCAAIPGRSPPSFVGSNYYCESGAEGTFYTNTYYLSDPLWDGAGCSANNTCCSNTNQPWFYHQLSEMTEDDIEVRICRDQSFASDAILIDILELYMQ